MDELATKYPQVTVVKGGESYEGRNIMGVHVSYSSENANKSVFLEGGIHAREWYLCFLLSRIHSKAEVLQSSQNSTSRCLQISTF